ncbi:MBL fold metallo-hydrolase [Microbacterium album]|uniref:MBL fold metallo-hydrolase n=1 Tax=Microbacterium album TaxID=2053191 RepID=A0A917MN57_9MICO|nr:MBL fold metallo-hydrolase [Microbacterium album]GGH48416.1 MBL fold metallo-hydrolase [Microbacterium album]
MNRPNDFPTPATLPTSLDAYALSGSFRVGAFTVHHLSDGLAFGPRQSWFHGIDDDVWMPVLGISDPSAPFPLNFGLFVVVGGGSVTLVDSGFGPEAERFEGIRGGNELLARLAEIGIAPEDVDHVLQTHLHPDHCGGLVQDAPHGAVPTFPRARVHVHAAEVAHWTGPDTAENFMAPYVRSRIEPIAAAGLLRTFAEATAIAPGVTALPLAGHTPGHTVALVADGDRSCLLVGDLAHHPVHFRHHDWHHDLDVDADAHTTARETLCSLAASLGAVVTAPHMPVLTLGRISRDVDPTGAPGDARWSWTRVDPEDVGGVLR